MALFKHKEFFEHSDDAAFDKLIAPNTDAPCSHPKTTTNMPEE
jgi:hypothetical protein